MAPLPQPTLQPYPFAMTPISHGLKRHEVRVTSFVGDRYEDDDTSPRAQRIVCGETRAHDFCDDADDWLTIEAAPAHPSKWRRLSSGPSPTR